MGKCEGLKACFLGEGGGGLRFDGGIKGGLVREASFDSKAARVDEDLLGHHGQYRVKVGRTVGRCAIRGMCEQVLQMQANGGGHTGWSM